MTSRDAASRGAMTDPTTLDEVIETVRGAREEGLDALAAMALSYGAMMDFGVHRIRALRGQVLAAERAMEDARSGLAEVCAARDSARIRAERAESEAAQLRAEAEGLRAEVASLRARPVADEVTP